jgi:hypothetical protein
MKTELAIKALESIDRNKLMEYHTYFDTLRTDSPEEIFRRALFAFASVHTTWRKNVDLYALLWDMGWIFDQDELSRRVFESRAGLTNNRTKFIWQFQKNYWADPSFYLKGDSETWPEYRDRVEKYTVGLGHAKTSFFVEMVYFDQARVVCGDTHQLQLYGLKGNVSPGRKMMNYVERHWVEECARLDLPPVTARWYLWDRKQKKTNSRYWSYVLEGGQPELTLPRQLDLFNLNELRKAA